MDVFKYTLNFSTTFKWQKYNAALSSYDLCSYTYLKDFSSAPSVLTAYTYSNVDAFGGMALCYLKFGIGSDLITNVHSNVDAEAWTKISADVMKAGNEVGNEGWISINTRTLIPN